jgi:oligopeptide/dipeptide ABC transporter ATP-binding protein
VSAAPLEIENLSVSYRTATGRASAVSDVSLSLQRSEIVGLVGESGCGKTTLSMAAMGLLPGNAEVEGDVRLGGTSIVGLDEESMRGLRGNTIATVVQNPLTSLDPMFSIGSQLVDAIRAHRDLSKREARERAIELLGEVGIPDPARRAKDPPHRFSGGQRQRIVIAIAIANEPSVLIADEPTTALDVTVQAQVLSLLLRLRREHGMAMLVITHDLGVVAQLCDRVGVMYAGQLVELASARESFHAPRHPYTRELLKALPSTAGSGEELAVIPGEIPDLEQPPSGCRFAPRCAHRMPICSRRPALEPEGEEARVACWLYGDHDESGVAETAAESA